MENELDYSKLGMKAGIEIHQQLDTGKLFCKCPGFLRSEEPHFRISRRLHKVAGETGEVDAAVAHEAALNREFVYEGYNDTTCLIELDEEPPKFVNDRALDEVLKIALLLNCEIYQNTQIMRKTVIDGSNTSGFQRTVLIGHNGFLETSFGKVKIESVALEEDSARIISKDEKQSIYRLDRLGIPLVEITTGPDMNDAEQVKECALKIGEIIRACKVRRGLGTIRQDLNVSIKGKNRIEIKGFQDPKMMVKTIELEIARQSGLIEVHDKIKKIKDYSTSYKDISGIFAGTEAKIIKPTLQNGGVIVGARLKGFAGLLGKEIGPNKRIGSEIAAYARMHGVGGLIHSDEDIKKYNLTEKEISAIRLSLECENEDAFIIVADKKEKALPAISSAITRALSIYDEAVLSEVRNAKEDGTSEFLRPMPGRARMYPETDLPLLYISRDKINDIKKKLPKTREEIRAELKKKGVNEELIELVLDDMDEFYVLMKVYSKDANLVAKMITLWRSEIATKSKKSYEEVMNILNEAVLERILEKVNDGSLSEGDVKSVMNLIMNGKDVDSALVIDRGNDDELEEQIRRIVTEKPGLRANAYMGLVITKLGTSVDKRKAMEILNRLTEGSK
jgi:glutamyl-tRNA(Gln) amidotransferase subunit E